MVQLSVAIYQKVDCDRKKDDSQTAWNLHEKVRVLTAK